MRVETREKIPQDSVTQELGPQRVSGKVLEDGDEINRCTSSDTAYDNRQSEVQLSSPRSRVSFLTNKEAPESISIRKTRERGPRRTKMLRSAVR